MLARLSSSGAWRAAPVGARMLRTTPARLGMLTTPMPAGGAAAIPDLDKFVTGETVAQHQVRVRHDNNAFRTHNYAVIGEPPPHNAVPVGGGRAGGGHAAVAGSEALGEAATCPEAWQ